MNYSRNSTELKHCNRDELKWKKYVSRASPETEEILRLKSAKKAAVDESIKPKISSAIG